MKQKGTNMQGFKGERIIIMATSFCNTKCGHCYIEFDGNFNPTKLNKIATKLLDQYDKVIINGAELLTDYAYLETVRLVKQPFIMSNGLVFLTDLKLSNRLIQYGINSISLSYHFDFQKKVSFISDITLLKIIERIANGGLDFRIMTTLSKSNYKHIKEIINYTYNLGARGIKFNNLLKMGNAKTLDGEILTQQQINDVLEAIKCEREKYNKNEFIIERGGTFGNAPYECNFVCTAIKRDIVLAPNQKVYPCVFLISPDYEIGLWDGSNILVYNLPFTQNICYARFCKNGF